MSFSRTLLGLIIGLAATWTLAADCDCSQIVDACTASVAAVDARTIQLTSTSDDCSRVAYRTDGDPQIVTFTGGSKSLRWFGAGSATDLRLTVDDCDVCRTIRVDPSSASSPGPWRPARPVADSCRAEVAVADYGLDEDDLGYVSFDVTTNCASSAGSLDVQITIANEYGDVSTIERNVRWSLHGENDTEVTYEFQLSAGEAIDGVSDAYRVDCVCR